MKPLTAIQEELIDDVMVICKNPPQSSEEFYNFIAEVSKSLTLALEIREASNQYIKKITSANKQSKVRRISR